MLVSFALGDANFLRRPCTFLFFCVDFFALGSKHKPHFQWNIGCVGSLALGLCIGHVDFMLFVHFFLAFGRQRKSSFWWNMGFSSINRSEKIGFEFIFSDNCTWSYPCLP